MFITLINYFHFALVGIKLITIFALVTNTNTMKKIIKMSVKLKLVDEINALEKRCIGESFTWSELKQISKEIESKLQEIENKYEQYKRLEELSKIITNFQPALPAGTPATVETEVVFNPF